MNRNLVYVLSLVLFWGCSNSSQDSNAPSTPPTNALGMLPTDKLSPLGDYLGIDFDNGRLKVAGPEGWPTGPRSDKDYLVQFVRKRGSKLPSITVTARDASFTDIRSSTRQNVQQFAALIKQEVGDSAIVEDVRPILIGDKACARYVKKISLNNIIADQQVLDMLHNGRIYSVNLRVAVNKVQDYVYDAGTVAAGLKFLETDEPASPAEEPATPPESADTSESAATE